MMMMARGLLVSWCRLAAVLLCCFHGWTSAYKMVEIEELVVPESPRAGQDVNLTCRFRLLGHNHRLYTVNWWRGKDQFYTYMATSPDPKHVYTFRGIHVKNDESTAESVVLRNVSEDTSGVYKCEVMGEGPSFRVDVKSKTMTVVGWTSAYKMVEIEELVVPESPQAGQDVNLTCRFRLLGHNHRLYTVNWWRGKDQFYTYKGTSPDPKHAYTFRGIHVKNDESTAESVVLRNVSEDTSGVYKCEVMGEGPSFRTAVKTKTMTVVAVEVLHLAPSQMNLATLNLTLVRAYTGERELEREGTEGVPHAFQPPQPPHPV